MVCAVINSGGVGVVDVMADVVGFGSARGVTLVVAVAGEGKLVSGLLVDVIGRCIVGGFAFLLRELVTYASGVFLIRGQAPGPHLAGPLADLLNVSGVFRISRGLSIGRNFP